MIWFYQKNWRYFLSLFWYDDHEYRFHDEMKFKEIIDIGMIIFDYFDDNLEFWFCYGWREENCRLPKQK